MKKFYEKTKDLKEHKIMNQIEKQNISKGNSIELGCGSGRDTIYLLKKGWKVLGIDKEYVKDIILEKIDDDEKLNFSFKKQKFEEISNLPNNNLIVFNFAISFSFCTKECFSNF